jgi:aspartate racemase
MVGILAGMGPAAGAAFYSSLVASTVADRDQDHLRVVMWADPAVPDRSEALLGAGPSPVEPLLSGLTWLREAGAAFVAMPCNTAHAFREELEQRSGVEVLDMVAASVRACRERVPDAGRVGVLSTWGTREAGLYERAAARVGIEVVQVDAATQQRHVSAAIACVKGGGSPARAGQHVSAAVAALRAAGAEVVVTACTELSLAMGDLRDDVPIVDSTDSLVGHVHQRLAQLQPPPSTTGLDRGTA